MTLPNTNRRNGTEANAATQFTWGRVPAEYTDTMIDWLLKRVTIAAHNQPK